MIDREGPQMPEVGLRDGLSAPDPRRQRRGLGGVAARPGAATPGRNDDRQSAAYRYPTAPACHTAARGVADNRMRATYPSSNVGGVGSASAGGSSVTMR